MLAVLGHLLIIYLFSSIDYASLELGGKSVANLVTTDSPQTISGHISVKASLIAAGDHLNIDHLVTHNNMFGANLSAIVATAVPRSDRMHISGHKWFQNVTIDRILFEHNDFWGIGSTKRVQELLDARNNDLLIGQSTIFHRDFVIDELIFTDFLNGISSADFGKQWLLFETDQVSKEMLNSAAKMPTNQFMYSYRHSQYRLSFHKLSSKIN